MLWLLLEENHVLLAVATSCRSITMVAGAD